MSIKRRQFLVLSSLTGFGLACLGNNLRATIAGSEDIKPPTSPPLLRFVSVADTGTGEKSQYAVAEAMNRYHQKNAFDLVVLAGDNIYNNGEMEKISEVFEQPYKPLLQQGVKFQACLGNHDIPIANGELQLRYPAFNMQGRYYTFRRGSVQFFALDTNHNADWNAQLPWLERELSRSDADWKVVFGHYPIYTSGLYGTNQNFINILTPLFQKYRVQLYINGHDHNYERTQPIDGTTYLICGAGSQIRPVFRSPWTAYSAAKLSFAAYDVYADKMIISGIGTDSRAFDRGVIQVQSV